MKPLKIVELAFLDEKNFPNLLPKEHDAFSVDTWAGLVARRLIKYNPGLDIETWRTRRDFDFIKEKNIYGIKGIVWPYRKPVVKNILTYDMFRRLSELSKNYFVILHYHSLFDLRFIIFSKLFPDDISVVLSHHGGTPPVNRKMKSGLIKLFLKRKNISYITYLTSEMRDYLKEIKNHPDIMFMPMGADFNMHNAGDKILARKKLNLEENKIYGIYVGSFYRLKNVDLILNAYNSLKKNYNFSVIFVGGENDLQNDLYEEVIESGCPYFNIQKVDEMTDFYNAADFYIHSVFNPDFGGIDVSWMEALACNIPVISSKLSCLDFDYSELGLCPVYYEDFLKKLEFMIKNFRNFKKCREISQKYLDGNTAIMKRLWRIYKKLYDDYVLQMISN